MEEAAEETPQRFTAPYSVDVLKEQALNKDSLPQFSLTPHPNHLSQEELENIRHSSRPLLGQRPKIIRICSIEVHDREGHTSSLTASKPIINAPRLDPHMRYATRAQNWQLNLSPADPIRLQPFPAEGKVVLILQHDRYVGPYDSNNLMEEDDGRDNEEEEEEEEQGGRSRMKETTTGASTCSYILPLVHEVTREKHPLFTHLQILVDYERVERVLKVWLMFVPGGETGLRGLEDSPTTVATQATRQLSLADYPMMDMLDAGMGVAWGDSHPSVGSTYVKKRNREEEQEERGEDEKREEEETEKERELKRLKNV